MPDVTSYDLGTAEQTLKASGFRVTVVYQHVTDANADGVVLSQTPQGGDAAAAEHAWSRSRSGSLTTGGTTTTGTTTTTP